MLEEDFDSSNFVGFPMGKRVLMAHPESACVGRNCSLHNPSEHALKDAKLHWRSDRGLMERICEHGIGHPDPDDLSFKKQTMVDYESYAFGVHGCCGCCGGVVFE